MVQVRAPSILVWLCTDFSGECGISTYSFLPCMVVFFLLQNILMTSVFDVCSTLSFLVVFFFDERLFGVTLSKENSSEMFWRIKFTSIQIILWSENVFRRKPWHDASKISKAVYTDPSIKERLPTNFLARFTPDHPRKSVQWQRKKEALHPPVCEIAELKAAYLTSVGEMYWSN